MFIGHHAVAFAAKRLAPQTSLGALFVATQLIDLLFPLFLLLGWEHVRVAPRITAVTPFDFYDYPITHSLVGSLGWAVLFGGLVFLMSRALRSAVVAGACVFSHWILDFLTHRPDLLLVPGGATRVGLGLWNSLPGTLIVEVGLFIAGIAVYLRTTTSRDRIGTVGLWSFVLFLFASYLANVVGPPPPDSSYLAIGGNLAWLLVLWAFWIDRHRQPLLPPAA